MLSASYWIYSLVLAAVAVCWSYVLVQPGMLLCSVQAWVRAAHKRWFLTRMLKLSDTPPRFSYGNEEYYWQEARDLDSRWWWKPLWGCYLCVAGQWGFWGYLLLFPLSSYSLLTHLGFVAITILFAAGWRAFYAWSQSIQ